MRRVVAVLAAGALAASLATTTAQGIMVRDTDKAAGQAVSDPAPVGVDVGRAQTAVKPPQSDEAASGRGTGTPEPVSDAENASRAAQVDDSNARADRETREVPVPAVSATSVPPSTPPPGPIVTAGEPSAEPSVSPSPSPSATPSPSVTPAPSTSDDPDPSPTGTGSIEPTATGSESVGGTQAREYGTCVPRVDRRTRSVDRQANRTSGNHLRPCGVAG